MEKLTKSSSQAIDTFIEKAAKISPSNKEVRLIFAMDATASRASTWEMACKIQRQMFVQTQDIANLNIQLVYYRGYQECKASRWHRDSNGLLNAMQKISCMGGTTQIERVLKHCLCQAEQHDIGALVFVGDCLEEKPDTLCALAGKLKLYSIPMFIFQEGFDAEARNCFQQLSHLSGGAYSPFDENSAEQLGILLSAVALYTSGGKEAMVKIDHPMVKKLSHQLK